MHFFKTLTTLALAAFAVAQSSSVSFTNQPSNVQVGKPVLVRYKSSDSSKPVTIILRKGNPANLSTIATLSSTVVGGSFNWQPAADLVPGNNYALEIKQGDEVNYTGRFSIAGGSSSAKVTSAPTYSTMTLSAASASSHVSNTASAMIVPMYNITSNHTSKAPYPYPTAYPTASASTGTIPMMRNTTFVSPTLKPTVVSTATVTPAYTSVTGATSSAATTTSSSTNAASSINSGLGLVLTVMAAVIMFN